MRLTISRGDTMPQSVTSNLGLHIACSWGRASMTVTEPFTEATGVDNPERQQQRWPVVRGAGFQRLRAA